MSDCLQLQSTRENQKAENRAGVGLSEQMRVVYMYKLFIERLQQAN